MPRREPEFVGVFAPCVGLPALRDDGAEVRVREEAVDEFFVGIGTVVFGKGFDFFCGGRQAGEVEREAADERATVGFGGWLLVFLFEAGEDEVVDFVAGPVM